MVVEAAEGQEDIDPSKSRIERSLEKVGQEYWEKLEQGEHVEVTREREGKFLLYWLTTTTTSTLTTYTNTYSLASLVCTPAGYTVKQC